MSGVPRGQKRKHEGTNTARKRRRVRTGSEEAPAETASSLGGVAVFNSTNAANVNERGGAAILKKVQLPAKRQRSAVPVPWVLVFRQPAPVPRAEREEDVGPAEFVEPEEAVEPEEGAELERAWCPTIDERC
ncbi:hypothetical protein F441_10929 [Phytophthora nicotianae CJ01A1]|uniref:Uncharacterized protein n=1 Tax=Phytophthora nicotianae CJ01A1 TaxID=1317063 RepID=W2WUR0_PHYNI|nr:hypothetical protein F441_10929 [Phytophthora nicotianae CJ01A1]